VACPAGDTMGRVISPQTVRRKQDGDDRNETSGGDRRKEAREQAPWTFRDDGLKINGMRRRYGGGGLCPAVVEVEEKGEERKGLVGKTRFEQLSERRHPRAVHQPESRLKSD